MTSRTKMLKKRMLKWLRGFWRWDWYSPPRKQLYDDISYDRLVATCMLQQKGC